MRVMYCPGAGFPPRAMSCPGFLPRVCTALSRVSSERVVSCIGAGFPQWIISLPWSRVSSEDNALSSCMVILRGYALSWSRVSSDDM